MRQIAMDSIYPHFEEVSQMERDTWADTFEYLLTLSSFSFIWPLLVLLQARHALKQWP